MTYFANNSLIRSNMVYRVLIRNRNEKESTEVLTSNRAVYNRLQ